MMQTPDERHLAGLDNVVMAEESEDLSGLKMVRKVIYCFEH
jgi:hypothetical protein